ncbi:MAG TPA: ABC transporter ATP-binding protein [Polyangia bacterium]
MPPILETNQLSRYYGTFRALAETSLSLQGGEIVVLAGPNGAGKSTLLLCLSGLLRPTSGQVSVEGFDLYAQEVQAKSRLAFVPDVPRFYTELTAWEHLLFMAQAYRAGNGFEARAEKLLKAFDLWQARDLYPQNYSRGMRLKLGLLLALIRPLRVLLLDEPASALDPEGVELLKSNLLDLRDAGAAILLSSHNPQIAQDLGARQWKMSQGQLEVA